MLFKSSALRLRAGLSALALSTAAGFAMAEEVTVWAWDPNFNGAAMQQAADRYAKINPDAKITVVDFGKGDLEQKLQTQLATGVTEGLPDIVLIEDYGAQKYLLSFPGAFEALNGSIDYSKFADYKVALASVGGDTYSLPFDTGVAGFFYRSDLLEQAGFSASDLDDATWGEVIEIAKTVAEKTGIPLFPIDLNDPGLVRIMLQSAGSWYFTPEGDLNLKGNPAFKAALQAYQDIVTTPEIFQTVSGWGDYTGSFTGGGSVGTVTGVWMTGTIRAADMPNQWGVAPVPKLEGVEGAVSASNLGGSSWYVLSSSEEKDTAIDFLSKVWGSDVDFYQDILVNQGAVGSFLPARNGAAYSSSDDYFGGQAVWQNFSDWLATVPAVNYGIFTNEVDSAVAAQLPALAKGLDVDEAIERIDAQARSQIQ